MTERPDQSPSITNPTASGGGSLAATGGRQIDPFEKRGLYRLPRYGRCWVCGEEAGFVDIFFEAPVCGAICSWASWEAMRLHDTPWPAWLDDEAQYLWSSDIPNG